MYCQKCNKEYAVGKMFCPICGKMLTVVSVKMVNKNDANVRLSCPIREDDNIMDISNMVSFDKYLTAADLRYALFTVGPFEEYLPKSGVGVDNAIDLTLVDINGGKVFKPIVYYVTGASKDLQIRNTLRPFFNKHAVHIRDTRFITDEQFSQYVEGDLVRFFVDKNDKTKVYVKYIRNTQRSG